MGSPLRHTAGSHCPITPGATRRWLRRTARIARVGLLAVAALSGGWLVSCRSAPPVLPADPVAVGTLITADSRDTQVKPTSFVVDQSGVTHSMTGSWGHAGATIARVGEGVAAVSGNRLVALSMTGESELLAELPVGRFLGRAVSSPSATWIGVTGVVTVTSGVESTGTLTLTNGRETVTEEFPQEIVNLTVCDDGRAYWSEPLRDNADPYGIALVRRDPTGELTRRPLGSDLVATARSMSLRVDCATEDVLGVPHWFLITEPGPAVVIQGLFDSETNTPTVNLTPFDEIPSEVDEIGWVATPQGFLGLGQGRVVTVTQADGVAEIAVHADPNQQPQYTGITVDGEVVTVFSGFAGRDIAAADGSCQREITEVAQWQGERFAREMGTREDQLVVQSFLRVTPEPLTCN